MPTTLLLGTVQGRLHTIAHPGQYEEISAPPPSLPLPKLTYPNKHGEPSFFSSANVTGVSRMKVCRVSSVITGVLLLYLDGSSRSLGWVSLGQLESSQEVSNDGIWFLIERVKDRFPQITKIVLTKPAVGPGLYFHAHGKEPLEWWFSYRQCQLSQDGRQTRPMTS